MLRAAKNDNGVIICIASDEGQEGFYPNADQVLGEWCDWTFEEVPVFEMLEGNTIALYFRENDDGDGIALRDLEDVEASPNG